MNLNRVCITWERGAWNWIEDCMVNSQVTKLWVRQLCKLPNRSWCWSQAPWLIFRGRLGFSRVWFQSIVLQPRSASESLGNFGNVDSWHKNWRIDIGNWAWSLRNCIFLSRCKSFQVIFYTQPGLQDWSAYFGVKMEGRLCVTCSWYKQHLFRPSVGNVWNACLHPRKVNSTFWKSMGFESTVPGDRMINKAGPYCLWVYNLLLLYSVILNSDSQWHCT